MKVSGMISKSALCVAIQIGLIAQTGMAEPVLARIVSVKGEVIRLAAGSSAGTPLRKGDLVEQGVTIHTHSSTLMAPIPGCMVLLGKDSELVIQKLDVSKANRKVKSRESALKLNRGSLLFALDEDGRKATHFTVETPHGSLNAKGTAGSIVMLANSLQATVSSGVVTFSASSGAHFDLAPGSVLNTSQGAQGPVTTIVNLVSKTVTTIQPDGTPSDAPASAEALTAASATFKEAVAGTLAAIGSAISNGLVSQAAADRIAGVIQQVNQSLLSAGLTAISMPAGGGQSGSSNSGSAILSSLNQGGSSLANPANTSGLVASPER